MTPQLKLRNLKKRFTKNKVPKIQLEVRKFVNKPTRVHTHPVRSAENIATVAESEREQPSTSFTRIEHYTHYYDANFALRSCYEAI